MINVQRVGAIVLRHLYNFRRNWDRVSDAVYWPVMDIILWGLSASWIAKCASNVSTITLALLTAVVFWQIVWRANYEVSVNLLEEMWSENLANLFATPLTPLEWVCGTMVLGIIKILASIVVGFVAVWLIYSLNIFEVGWMFIPYAVSLTLSGWFIGFMAAGLIIYFGQKIQTLAWSFGYILAPFSGVFYSIDTLPEWARYIAYCLPTSYVFEGMRAVLFKSEFRPELLLISFLLNFLYLAVFVWFFLFMFEKRRERGFQKGN